MSVNEHSVNERDDYTGHATTGHEWNGIKELNTPVPRAVYVFLLAAFIFSVGYWILMPTWPLGVTYTRGLLGLDQRNVVQAALERAARDRSVWTTQIETQSYSQIQANPQLMDAVRQTGRTLFLNNCAACHGRDARGQKGFPSLTTPSLLWGNDPDAIAETIRVGINSAHPDTRTSQMPAFGHDQMLKPDEVDKVVAFVRTLSNPDAAKDALPGQVEAGQALFAANCAACHGDDGNGKTDVGAPNLTDKTWLYGGDPQTILTTVWNGRQGHMPTWESRLSKVDRKILALYIVDKRVQAP